MTVTLYRVPQKESPGPKMTVLHFYDSDNGDKHLLAIRVRGEVDLRHYQQTIIKVAGSSETCYDIYVSKR